MRTVTIHQDHFPLRETFTISRGSRDRADVIRVQITEGGCTGQGECVPYARYGETPDSVMAQIRAIETDLSDGMDHGALQRALPSGAARNAVDCALWDLAAKRESTTVQALVGLPSLEPVTTAYTIGIGDADAMRKKAAENAERPILKIKLGSAADLERLRAVRAGAPDANLIVDANEAWTNDEYLALLPALQSLRVTLIEQPFHADADVALDSLPRPIPVCADESCHDRQSLEAIKGRYDLINIKLDKTGGLTEALALKREATSHQLGIMVGCMVGSSLAMAPAQLIAQGVECVDLDGPLLLAEDRTPAIIYQGSQMLPADPTLWG